MWKVLTLNFDFSDHSSNRGDLPRNDSSISLEDNVDERYIRVADKDDSLEDVFIVDLEKCQAEGLGLGLIDGMVSPLFVLLLVLEGEKSKIGQDRDQGREKSKSLTSNL